MLFSAPASPPRHVDVEKYRGKYKRVYRFTGLREREAGWHCDKNRWDTTAEDVVETARCFAAAVDVQRRAFHNSGATGEPNPHCKLTWGHSDDPRAVCGDVLDCVVAPDGKSFDVIVGTNSPKAIGAIEANRVPVSIKVEPEFVDGEGNVYPLFLRHVALVQHPILTGQAPGARLMSRSVSPRRSDSMPGLATLFGRGKKRRPAFSFADGDGADAGGGDGGSADAGATATEGAGGGEYYSVDPAATEAPLTAVVQALNDQLGLDLSDRITNWNEFLLGIEGVDPSEIGSGDDSGGSDQGADATAPLAGVPAAGGAMGRGPAKESPQAIEMSRRITELEARIKKQDRAERERRVFEFSRGLDAMAAEKRISGGERAEALGIAKAADWKPSVMDMLGKRYAGRKPGEAVPDPVARKGGELGAAPTPKLGADGAAAAAGEEPKLERGSERAKQLAKEVMAGKIPG